MRSAGSTSSRSARGTIANVADQPDVTTVHLGQFTRETANAIAGELEELGIVWWYKEPGFFSQIWEVGVRLFVDRAHLAKAKEIAERLSRGPGDPPPPPVGPADD